MKHPDKDLLRLACRLRDRIVSGQGRKTDQIHGELGRTLAHLQRLESVSRQMDRCSRRSFLLAARHLRDELSFALRDLTYATAGLQRALDVQPSPIPTLRDLVDDLFQLRQEFGSYAYDHELQVLSVVTDSIELGEIVLGPFRIELSLRDLGRREQGSVLAIVALEPNPAACNEEVTHPHVSGERMCAGEATAAIEVSLAAGRIADVFLLVRSVLLTYNASSPYVHLESWYGTPCKDCGHVPDDDDRYTCQQCEESFCSECICSCPFCDSSICQDCLVCCPFCEEHCCKQCLEACDQCGREVCSSCKAEGLCPSCVQEQETENSNEQEQELPQAIPAPAAAGALS